jgi:glycosyltransferase involved in cell wall biosynthesis
MKIKQVGTPLVSVVIPNFNYGQYLDRCISSVLSQTYSNIEIIFVDDGSTDKSLAIAEKFKNRVRIYSQLNKGVNAARNVGLLNSNGELIALCDSDDYWAPKKLEAQVDIFQKNPQVGLVYCSYSLVDKEENYLSQVNARYEGNLAELFISMPTRALISCGGSTSIFKRELLKDSLLFDESLRGNGEDWDFFRRLCKSTQVELVKEPLAYIRKHTNSRGARDLNHFYVGNKASVMKAAFDNYYQWTFLKRWRFFARFELMMFKTCLSKGKFIYSLIHLFRVIFPYWFRKQTS